MEIWKPIAGFVGFEVSSLGRVRSFRQSRTGRILKPFTRIKGYLKVELCFEHQKQERAIHCLVAEAFISNPLNKPCVNHINGIKTDNRVENLEWCTYSENNRHALDTGLRPTGGERSSAKLTNEQARQIRELYKPYDSEFSAPALARKFGLSKRCVLRILHGKTYKAAGGELRYAPPRIPDSVRNEIRRLYVKGDKEFGTRPLSRRYGVDRKTIDRIVSETY